MGRPTAQVVSLAPRTEVTDVEIRRYLQGIGNEVKNTFTQNRMLLSFEQYLELCEKEPARQARNAAQYVRDVFDYYESVEQHTPVGTVKRFRLFDCDFRGGVGRVAGQEEVQTAVYRILSNFVRNRQVDKLILLHGPNGSAKSSLISAIEGATSAYSRKPEGALYRFNWVFPSDKLVRGAIGFAEKAGESVDVSGSYALLEGDAIDARLQCEVKDHPLFLLPKHERRRFLERLLGEEALRPPGDADAFTVSDYVANGDLCHKCRQIYSALLTHYQGDYLRVLRHIQVERFYISSRYHVGIVAVEPQLSVDASYRQITADRSHASLPPALLNLSLLEPSGPLVAGNRGIVEYSDLLKRPLEHFKYLLGASENQQVALDHFTLFLDTVLLASSNEKHLAAFKEMPDFASFKGRIELVRVPYLRRHSVERQIYDQQLQRASLGKHVAPHATFVAALWAVLTRLKKPIPERYNGDLRELIDDLTPLEKLQLYDAGEVPDRLGFTEAKDLRQRAEEVYRESDSYPNYEGRSGASAREIKTAIGNAAQNPAFQCLTPQAILEELAAICKDKSVYEFLQQETVDGYHDHEGFVPVAEGCVLSVLDDEIRDSMGLVSEAQYREIFERYVQNVSHWVKNEKMLNRVTGAYEPPQESLMTELEGIIMPKPSERSEERGDFRRGLIAAVGAYRLDNPADSQGNAQINYQRIFPDQFRRLRDHYYEEHKKQLRRSRENVLKVLAGDKSGMSLREVDQVGEMLNTMTTRYGYCRNCARDAILFLLRKKYAD